MPMGDIITCECSCREGEKYADGTLPHFYANEDEQKLRRKFDQLAPILQHPVTKKFYRDRGARKLYWGLHLDGKHVVNIVYSRDLPP